MLATNEEGKGMLPITVISYHTSSCGSNLQPIGYQIQHHVLQVPSGEEVPQASGWRHSRQRNNELNEGNVCAEITRLTVSSGVISTGDAYQ